MLFGSVFWFPMMLNDPCDHRYVLYALGEGLGNLWEASGLPPQPPGVIAGGVRLVSLSAVSPASSERNTIRPPVNPLQPDPPDE